MKLHERRGNAFLEGITRDDIYYSNLGAEKREDSSFAPHHDFGLWISDMDILEELKSMGVKFREYKNDKDPDDVNYSVNFRAYPPNTGRILVRKDGGDYLEYDPSQWQDIDKARGRVQNIDIRFHVWAKHGIPSIDEMKVDIE